MRAEIYLQIILTLLVAAILLIALSFSFYFNCGTIKVTPGSKMFYCYITDFGGK